MNNQEAGRLGGKKRTAKTKNKGFASMDPKRHKLVSSLGGTTNANNRKSQNG